MTIAPKFKWLFIVCLSCPVFAQAPPGMVGAGYNIPLRPRFAPGQIMTLFVNGLSGSFFPPVLADTVPLPSTLAGVTVSSVESSRPGGFTGDLPILAIADTIYYGGGSLEAPAAKAITVQMPALQFCPPGGSPNPCWYVPILALNVKQGGVTVPLGEMVEIGSSPHVLNSCDTSVSPLLADAITTGQLGGGCFPLVTHGDGSVVTAQKPARLGETVVFYATGLGFGMTPDLIGKPAPSGGVPVDPSFANVGFDFNPAIDPPASAIAATTPPAYIGLTAGLVGTYQVNVLLPAAAPANARTCEGFADTNLGINFSFTGVPGELTVRLCVVF